MVEAARGAVPSQRALLVGVGRESTRATIAAARRAGAGGADAVVVRTPSLYRAHTSVAALFTHYIAVADASPVPVLLYNYPAFTGVNLAPESIGRLAEHPEHRRRQGNEHRRRTVRGDGRCGPRSVHDPVRIGARLSRGAVRRRSRRDSGGGLRRAGELHRARASSRWRAQLAEALAIQQRLMPLARAVTTGFGIAGLKAALDVAGYVGGDPRPPLRPLAADGVEKIRTFLEGLHAPVN